MSRVLMVALVLMLSGVPAATVACDLLWCGDRATPAAAQSGCHDHAASQPSTQIAPRTGDCMHLSAAEPYLGSASRMGLQLAGSTPFLRSVCEPVPALLHAVDRILSHGPPGASPATSCLPLRI